MVTISRSEYEKLQALEDQNRKLSQQVDWLTELILLARKKQFGSSSERASEEVMEQMSFLFNEAEVFSDAEATETKETAIAAHTRKKRSGSVRDVLPKGTKVEVTEHRLPEEERICQECGSVLTEIGKEVVQTLEIIPTQVVLHEDWYYTYVCETCKMEGTNVSVLKTPKEKPVITGSFASAKAVAHIMTQKFVMGSPLYRQEQELNRQGVMLSRQTMSNWLIKSTEEWLLPVYTELKKELVSHDLLHADETEIQVLKEPGKAATTDSYIWLYRTSGDAEHPVVLYEYQDSRRQACPREFLGGFKGFLQTDGYAGYNAVENVTHVGCWAHARRKFDEAVAVLPAGKKTGSAVDGQSYCSKLFAIENDLSTLTQEERYNKRLELEKPVLDALFAWAEQRTAAPKSKLGQALTYLKNQRQFLTNYLMDGRIELSNNRAERSIKSFVIARKNFLFANTPSGAQSSAIIFSLIETAKENGLDPYRYLTYVLNTAPNLDRSKVSWAALLLPANAPEACSLPVRTK